MSQLRTAVLNCLGLLLMSSLGVQGTAQDIPVEFTNLQILPKGIPRQDLMADMRGFALGLGVRCNYCHAPGQKPGTMDFASDDLPPKRTARIMLRMTADINHNYVAGVTQATTVECVTCHRGSAKPRTLQVILSETIDQGGLASAVSQYRQLRKENYGNGKFDFSESSLNLLSESLLKKGKAKEAA